MGGPKREFLRLVVKAANEDSGIIIGPAGCRSLFPNFIGMCLLCLEVKVNVTVEHYNNKKHKLSFESDL